MRIWILFLLLVSQLHATLIIPDKHPLDLSEYRRFTLDNGLKVLLLHDPKFNTSAASMDIPVGSMGDPREFQGMAHFLEHMLFLGTKKYPRVDDYSSYLKSNGGYSNAFTAEDHTNYHFQVDHHAFGGALDRFAQFFISPLFSPKFTKREMNAVHSEHKKNIQNDGWRKSQLYRSFLKKNHPANHFGTGNLDTLSQVTPEELKKFYKAHYSSNKMALVLLSRKSLDWMEAEVRKVFLEVPNHSIEDIHFDADFFPKSDRFRLFKIAPVKDIRTLSLNFSLPALNPHFKSKPASLIGHIIGHEGRGSLLSRLKELGWATSLSAGGYSNTKDYASFSISIQLTPQGLQEYKEVLLKVFAYLEMMRAHGFQNHIFDELRTMTKMDEVYSDKGEGTGRAVGLASNINAYSLELAEKVDFLLEEKDSVTYKKFLEQLNPQNMITFLVAKGLETDKEEAYYSTPYSYEEDKTFSYELGHPKADARLFLPEANPFLPSQAKPLSLRPIKILEEEGMEVWYLQDTVFKRPKVRYQFRVCLPRDLISTRTKALQSLYVACINEQLAEVSYPAMVAGLHYGVSEGFKGITIDISGYDDSADELLSKVLEEMSQVRLSESLYQSLKEKRLRGLKNFLKGQAYKTASSLSKKLTHRVAFTPSDLIQDTKSIDLDEVKAYAEYMFRETYTQAFIHGNTSQEQAKQLSLQVKETLGGSPLAKDKIFKQSYLSLPPGKSIRLAMDLDTNNSSYRRTYDLGEENPSLNMLTTILGKFVSNPFFMELRTRQQLGYIVGSGASVGEERAKLIFVVQSETHDALDLNHRAEKFISTFPEIFSKMSDEKFAQILKSVEEDLLKKPKSIASRASELFSLTFTRNEDFDRREKALHALKKITRKKFAEFIKNVFAKDKRKIVEILTFANQHKSVGEKLKIDRDILSLKNSLTYMNRAATQAPQKSGVQKLKTSSRRRR